MQADVGVALLHAVDERVRLLEVVKSVEEDQVDGGRVGRLLGQLREHVDRGEAGQAEGRGLEEVGEEGLAEAEDVESVHVLELLVQVVEMRLGERNQGKVGGRRVGRSEAGVNGGVIVKLAIDLGGRGPGGSL